ncbi:MAG: Uncharacterised protein [Halieaceae bacterium]|nr:MAG: Uncharacterised protein [Halieaceae bacterium]
MSKLSTTRQQDVRNLLADQAPTQGHITVGDRLGEGDQIRLRAISLKAKPLAGATKATDDLIGDQQNVPLVEDALHLRPVRIRGHDHTASTLHRFCNKSRHAVLAELINLFLEL